MRRLDRGAVAPPPSLTNSTGAGPKELVAARDHFAKPRSRSFGFKAYKGDDVKLALRVLCHGKCAYCETFFAASAPVDVEHYRPKGAIEGEKAHRGYWWLAMSWDNLLPSCIDCNRRRKHTTVTSGMTLEQMEKAYLRRHEGQSGKKDAFPIRGPARAANENEGLDSENPLLLDPSHPDTDPCQHLRWALDGETAMVVPTTENGEEDPNAVASIHIYGLNRLDLVQNRTALLRDLQTEAEQIRRLINLAGKPRMPKAARDQLRQEWEAQIATMKGKCDPKREYSELARAFVEEFQRALARER